MQSCIFIPFPLLPFLEGGPLAGETLPVCMQMFALRVYTMCILIPRIITYVSEWRIGIVIEAVVPLHGKVMEISMLNIFLYKYEGIVLRGRAIRACVCICAFANVFRGTAAILASSVMLCTRNPRRRLCTLRRRH